MQLMSGHPAQRSSASVPPPAGGSPTIPTAMVPPDPGGTPATGPGAGPSRRTLVRLTALAGAGAFAGRLPAGEDGTGMTIVPATTTSVGPDHGRAQHRALAFLDTTANAYPDANPSLRLAQSYADEVGLFSTAFVYDNALAICAYLACGRRYLTRARQLADALLYAQDHDPEYTDGRLRQAYNVGPYIFHDGTVQEHGFRLPDGTVNTGRQFGFLGTAVGDVAWAGIALVQLYDCTRDRRYLSGALRIGHWIVARTRSDQPLGGFRFGVDGANAPITISATEHNIDAAALFALLARADHDRSWLRHRWHACGFVARMWDPAGGFFSTGSNDGRTVNPRPVPEDAQTWSWLALRHRRYARALEWTRIRLSTTDTPDAPHSQLPDGVRICGVTFSTASLTSSAEYNGRTVNRSGVWLEGTAHLAAALSDRSRFGDRWAAAAMLRQLSRAQDELGGGQHLGGVPLPDGSGLVSASSLIDTGFGYGYFQVRHLGTTAWYLLAARSANPLRYRGLTH